MAYLTVDVQASAAALALFEEGQAQAADMP